VYPGADLVAKLRDSARVPIQKVALHMITTSDNTASLWLQGLVGGAAINAWLAAHGFDSTRVNSRVPGREADRARMGWGQTTPREMARLVTMIRDGRAVSRAASEEMYRYLTRIYWNGEALSQLPPWVQAASKQGAVDRSRSEVVLVNAPSGDYVFCVITKNQRDTSYVAANQGYVLLRRVSALLWREFEPDRPWAPDSGAADVTLAAPAPRALQNRLAVSLITRRWTSRALAPVRDLPAARSPLPRSTRRRCRRRPPARSHRRR